MVISYLNIAIFAITKIKDINNKIVSKEERMKELIQLKKD